MDIEDVLDNLDKNITTRKNAPKEKPIPEKDKRCATCGKDESDCPTRPGCFTPDYKNWVPPGEKKEGDGCGTCSHWVAVKIGKFCPDCGQKL